MDPGAASFSPAIPASTLHFACGFPHVQVDPTCLERPGSSVTSSRKPFMPMPLFPSPPLARVTLPRPHTHIPHPPDPRPRAADWLPILGGGEKSGGGRESLPCPNPPLSSAQGQQLRFGRLILYLLLGLSREQNSSPSAASLGRDKSGYPRWGLAGSSPPAQPRTEEILKRNSTCAGGTEGVALFTLGWDVQWVSPYRFDVTV